MRFIRKLAALALVFILLWGSLPAKAADNLALDLVIVLDHSGSMSNSNDKEDYALDAASAMLALCNATASRAAIFCFSDKIYEIKNIYRKFYDISLQGGNQSRIMLIENLNNRGMSHGYGTDLGLGLKTAVNMFGDQMGERKPVILFLTDGGIDFTMINNKRPTEQQKQKKIQESEKEFEDALTLAKANGITIYTLALQDKKPYDTSLIEKAAKETGGLFERVRRADELPAFFNRVFANEVSSEVISLSGTALMGEEGFQESKIIIPNHSVSETNIIVNTNKDCELYTPAGQRVSFDNKRNFSFASNHLRMYKLLSPKETGTWKLRYPGPKGNQSMGVNVVFSYKLTPVIVLENTDNIKKRDQVSVKVHFLDEYGKPSKDESLYLAREDSKGIVAHLTFTGPDGKVYFDKDLEKQPDGFYTLLSLDELNSSLLKRGEYTLSCTLRGDGMNMQAEPVVLSIQNQAPQAIGKSNKFSNLVIHDPTQDDYESEKTDYVNLDEIFSDADDEPLIYAVEKAPQGIALTIEQGGVLKLVTNNQSINGTAEVSATDSEGDRATYSFPIEVDNVRQRLQKDTSLRFSTDSLQVEKNTDITIKADVFSEGVKVTDEELLSLVKSNITYQIEGQPARALEFTKQGDIFKASFKTGTKTAQYTLSGQANIRGIALNVEPLSLRVGNVPPQVQDELVQQLPMQFLIEPFLWECENQDTYTLDLAEHITDTITDKLTYTAFESVQPAKEDMSPIEKDPLTLKGTQLTLSHMVPGKHSVLVEAEDTDKELASFTYEYVVISQKARVVHFLLQVGLCLLGLFIIILLFYWIVFRKSWDARKYGLVKRTLNGNTTPNVGLPNSGKRDVRLSSLLRPNDLADSSFDTGRALKAAMDQVGKAVVLRPKSGGEILVTLKGKLPASCQVKVGASDLGKRRKARWSSSGTITLLIREPIQTEVMFTRQKNAGTYPMAARKANLKSPFNL